MKKIEILKLIESRLSIEKNNKLLSITKYENNDRYLKPECRWFPNIPDLKEEFDVLKEEVKDALDENKKNESFIQSVCTHDVRLTHYGLFTDSYKCVLCDEYIESDNNVTWNLSKNRNKYCVNLIAKYQEGEDYGYVSDGYTKEDVYKIILNILENRDDDEDIDLIQEFKKLNLKNCDINEEKKKPENFILIIDGSNKQFVDDDTYITTESLNLGFKFAKEFLALLNTKVKLISNKDYKEDNYDFKLKKYTTKEEIEELLHDDISYKLIIDLSEIYDYKVSEGEILKESYDLKLSERYPNSKIIKIINLSKNSLEKLTEYLRTFQQENLYAYHPKEDYYYLENDTVKKNDFEETCGRIKRLLKK